MIFNGFCTLVFSRIVSKEINPARHTFRQVIMQLPVPMVEESCPGEGQRNSCMSYFLGFV